MAGAEKNLRVSAAEQAARARGMRGNQELAEQFGVNEGDYVRELVKVSDLPTPPSTEVVVEAKERGGRAQVLNLDEAVMNVLRDEAEGIAVRLQKFGVPFGPEMQQSLVDYAYSLMAMNGQGIQIGGGAISRR